MELLCQLNPLDGEPRSHHARRELAAGDSQAEIRALMEALAESDGDTYRHSLEVAATARAVGERPGIDAGQLVELERGAGTQFDAGAVAALTAFVRPAAAALA